MFSFEDDEESQWSLKDYQDELRRRKEEDPYSTEAWEDMERSIVANLADDIEVGISKGKIKMTVTKDLSESLSSIGSKAPLKVTGTTFINSAGKNDKMFYDVADKLISELSVSKKDALHLKLLVDQPKQRIEHHDEQRQRPDDDDGQQGSVRKGFQIQYGVIDITACRDEYRAYESQNDAADCHGFSLSIPN